MFKRLQHLSLSVPLSQIIFGISCLLTTSAIANPMTTTSLRDRANTSQEAPSLSDRLTLEVPNSIAPDRSVDRTLDFEELLTDLFAEVPVAENPYLPCPTSTSTTSANDSTTSQPLPIREGETTESTSPPISCVAHLTNIPTSLESLKTEQKLSTPASTPPIAYPIAQENAQENAQDSPPKSSPDQPPSDTAKPADDSNRWHIKFQPYFTVPVSTYGTNTIGDRSVSYNLSLSEVLSALNFAIYGRLEAWNNNLGFIVDASYQNLGGVANASRNVNRRQTDLSVSTSFSQGIYDFAVSYHFGDPAQYSLPDKPSNKSFPQFWFEPILGVRLNSIDAGLDITFQRQQFDRSFQRTVSRGRTWLEPMIGAKFGLQVSDPVILWLRGDISGFGLAGNPDLQWNVITGADWWISPTTSLQLAYRFYQIDYGNNDQSFKLGYNGPYIGVTFNF